MDASIVRWSKTHTLITSLLVITMVVGISLWRSVLHTLAQSTPACPTSYILNIAGGTTTATTPIGGIVPLQFGAPTLSNNVTATRVDFYSSTVGFLGTAVMTSSVTNGTYWNLPLYTQLLPNAAQVIYANVSQSDGNSCNSQQLSAIIYNPTTAQLGVSSNPPMFSGPTNTVVNFSSDITVNGASVLPYANINWETTVGTIEKLSGINGAARLFTGPQAINGKVSIIAKYGGKTVTIAVPVNVASSSTTTSTSTTTAPISSTTAATAISSTTAQTTPLADQTKVSTSVQDCAVLVLGAQKATDIKAGIIRPTSADLEKLKPCFAQSNYVVPNTFAPVDPFKIKNLSKNADTKISDLSNVTSDSKIAKIKISGKGKPNTTVILYFFSEPLVITTSSDSQGNWSYTLEDPLAPGNHEVYAVVDKGDGQYQKTDPFSFLIGRASASAENPGGLSLKLENDPTPIQSNRSLYVYLVIFGVLLVAGLLFTLWLFRRWSRHNDIPPPTNITFTPPSPPATPNFPV